MRRFKEKIQREDSVNVSKLSIVNVDYVGYNSISIDINVWS